MGTPAAAAGASGERETTAWWVELRALPAEERSAKQVTLRIARVLALPLADTKRLMTQPPVALPKRFSCAEAEDLAEALRDAGAEAGPVPAPTMLNDQCATHESLSASRRCARCAQATCTLCVALAEGESLCGRCRRRRRRSRTFYRLRVATLLVVLLFVLLWAWRDVTRRKGRTEWDHPLTVGLIIVRRGAVDDAAIAALRSRTRALEERLAREFRRYRREAPEPFHFVVLGPVDVDDAPPAPRGDGPVDMARHSVALWSYLRDVDALAEVEAMGLDSRLYVVARPPDRDRRRFVEGTGEQGGRVGIVEVQLDATMVDFALFVAAHELFHTLGATDKYDASGRTLEPDGLAEPDRVPRYPQRYAELMARSVPVSATTERPPDSLDELRVGPATALEIGWLSAP
jgi:hypothetical protein